MNYRLLPGILLGCLFLFPPTPCGAVPLSTEPPALKAQLFSLVEALNQEVYHTQLWLKAWESQQVSPDQPSHASLPAWGALNPDLWQALVSKSSLRSGPAFSDLHQTSSQFQHQWAHFQHWTESFDAHASSPVELIENLKAAGEAWIQHWPAHESYAAGQWQFAKLVDQALLLSETLLSGSEANLRVEHQRLIAFRKQALAFSSPDNQAMFKQIDQVVQICQEFINGAKVPAHYAWGADHYYYNYLLLPHLAGPGEGLIAQYNQWQLGQSAPMPPRISPWPAFPPEAKSPRPSQNLIFLVDNSGSMEKSGKLARVRHYLQTTLPQLSPNQLVAIIGFSGKNEIILPFTKLGETGGWENSLDRLKGEGKANSLAGFELAYMLAGTHASGKATVVLITDGGFDILDPLPQRVAQASAQGKALHIRHVGQYETAVRKRLQKLAELGGGSYAKMPVSGGLPALIELP
ncbi:MAG: VWA domain-containing protein [Bacteroidota bacterium]